jgi:protein-L-isoaspartate(D-aspartate) O-methyltransferase
MVGRQLRARDIDDPRVLDAFGRIPRHRFLDPGFWDEAYEDHPVRIGCEQTISQPYIVARMTQLLRVEPDHRVLEVGTGSGYQTAILLALGCEVHSIDRHEPLVERAAGVLEDLGLDERLALHVGDGTLGVPEEAPFDRILVTAAAPAVPGPLREQLSPRGGRMVIPVGRSQQQLRVLARAGTSWNDEADLDVIFVPLVGEAGF